jgi:hypothetical protein
MIRKRLKVMIKKLSMFAFMALSISTPVKAADISDFEVKSCEMLGAAANLIMTARQYGTSPILIRQQLKDILVENELLFVMKMVDAYITEAYEQTAYSTEKMQDWAITSFKSDKEAECLRYFFEKDDA